jgi:hypothetical protein
MAGHIDLGKAFSDASDDHLWAVRAKAIQAYASLEQSRCGLFRILAQLENEVAGIIFFRITSPRVVDTIIEKTLRFRHGALYNVFWNSVGKELGVIAIKRNDIVHWNTHLLITDSGPELRLSPPNHWIHDENTPFITTNDLKDYIHKCDFFARSINMFCTYLNRDKHPSWEPEHVKPWHDIFQQPLTYPVPDTHLLYRKP